MSIRNYREYEKVPKLHTHTSLSCYVKAGQLVLYDSNSSLSPPTPTPTRTPKCLGSTVSSSFAVSS